MRIGIFFGGRSREREISFAGGRTVFDCIDKKLFTPVPIFVDSFGQFILLNWQFIYKGSIRDFYPSVKHLPTGDFNDIQVYAESLKNLFSAEILAEDLGQIIEPTELNKHIDFAFLALHGAFGEDGSLQGMLQYLNIPYSGSGINASALGMSKSFQKEVLGKAEYSATKNFSIYKNNWNENTKIAWFEKAKNEVGFPLVIRPSNQGSSIGVGILKTDNFQDFNEKINDAFFLQNIKKEDWEALNFSEKKDFIRQLCDIRSGIGLPLLAENKVIYLPETLFSFLNNIFQETEKQTVILEALDGEFEVLVEEFIDGREFSCIVLRNENGESIALPPTEIVKGQEVYDYRSKYLPGKSTKITPIDLPETLITKIADSCKALFEFLRFEVYARIDGFIKADGTVILNDPNTTSGMLPSSFFFHQAAEIGLNPTQFISLIIRNSLAERIQFTPNGYLFKNHLNALDEQLNANNTLNRETKKVAVILGGYSSERHISVESGRNIYEKLSSSSAYEVTPIFLTGDKENFELFELPINILLKDNADDILAKIKEKKPTHPFLEKLRTETETLSSKYLAGEKAIFKPTKIDLASLAKKVDFVFIALHGRPGEDGALQSELEKHQLPFNGSKTKSSSITIDKYKCNQLLKEHGILVAEQQLAFKQAWQENEQAFIKHIEAKFAYPFICKPVDDGCSSAVKLIKNQKQLKAYNSLIFRDIKQLNETDCTTLGIQAKEEIPQKDFYLIENFIQRNDAKHFLEITGGMLTNYDENGKIAYEIFEPSETLSGTEILSLEEKFLAGEGQNITPARFAKNKQEQQRISDLVRADLEKTARILNVEAYARIDAFVRIFENGKVETIIIEVNSLPGMTPATCIFHQAAINSYKPFDFINAIINFGIERINR